MRCLACGYEFFSSRDRDEDPVYCWRCKSTDVISQPEIDAIVEKTIEFIKTTPFGVFPRWDAIRGIVAERVWRSKRYKFTSMLNLLWIVMGELKKRGVIP
jgi:hypothetical protein